MKILLSIVSLFLSVSAIAQQDLEMNLGDFKEIKVYDMINVELVKSDDNKAIISGDNKSDVELVNKNGTLKIKMRLGESFVGNKTTVRLYYKNIAIIDVNEGAYVSSDGIFQQYKIELRAQEGGVIKVPLEVTDIQVKAVTGGDIEVSGKADRQDISINTGGIFRGKSLESEATYVAIRAAGEAHINASRLADIKIRAGGDVYIYGNPETVNENKLFGGRINRMD
ncbi:head GIN domain-containing protein [Gelidibacter sp.]|uniref:head GIN domain-containing protein n=1 Tax=Gelidibacter sp. TaxID=2018083 RepID=UPI002B76E5BC|nr:head GIN domain-containing protein [Gelidibacter sp.]HUH29000.1 head GIN domain-containing protein [Gelidibacter sp.]